MVSGLDYGNIQNTKRKVVRLALNWSCPKKICIRQLELKKKKAAFVFVP